MINSKNVKNLSMEEAIDNILTEETVGNFSKDSEFFGKKPKLTDNKKNIKPLKLAEYKNGSCIKSASCCEEDEEVDMNQLIEDKIIDLLSNLINVKSLKINEIITRIGPSQKRDIMGALQRLSNKKVINIDKFKNISLNEGQSEEDEQDIIDDIVDEEGSLTNIILDILDTNVSGSVSGMTSKDIIKAVKQENEDYSKPEVISAIKNLLKSKKIVKGPIEGTLIINSVEEDGEIPTGVIHNTPSSTEVQANQALTNGETKDTLKAKGWKETNPGIFTSPDGKQKFAITSESKNFKINNIMFNSYKDDDFEALLKEAADTIDEIENGITDDNSTEGLDEFNADEDTDTDEVEGDDGEDSYTVTLTADEYNMLMTIVDKLKGAHEEMEAEDDYIDDEATDEKANAELMGDEEDIDFSDEEDEENFDETGSGLYDGAFKDGAAKMDKHTGSYGNERRAPITSKHFAPKGCTAFDGAGRNGGASLSKETPEYKSKSGKPVQSKNSSAAGSSKSIFEI